MTFASGLRSILRNDPDIIMVGEIRDAKRQNRCRVSTHGTPGPVHSPHEQCGKQCHTTDRMGVEPTLFLRPLRAYWRRGWSVSCARAANSRITYQGRNSGTCSDFPLLGRRFGYYIQPVGCIHRNNTGYLGRTGIFELLTVTENIRKLVIRDASLAAIQSTAEDDGMITMRADGLNKVRQGITSVEEILRVIV